jgi:hypothetical protein
MIWATQFYQLKLNGRLSDLSMVLRWKNTLPHSRTLLTGLMTLTIIKYTTNKLIGHPTRNQLTNTALCFVFSIQQGLYKH